MVWNALPRATPGYDSRVNKIAGSYRLENSLVVISDTPAGKIARVESERGCYWAGPLSETTVSAIKEVGRHVR